MKSILTAAAIIGLGLVATGCTATTPAAPSPSAPATSAASSPAPTMSESAAPDIVDTAVAAGDFTTLAQALTAAGLVETLKGEGPFTVFAPTDEAFAKLPDGALDGLLKDKEALTGVLTYHVVPGEVMAAQVAGMDGQKVTTVQGGTFTVNVKDGKVSLTDGAGNTVNVVKTDITASNGVIHVIDGVLLPSK
ncbi:Immunogenic protein MPT70 [Propionicimonas sp. T2.31MG-18]|uniref:fasciclin domain-containing protein n=1 Tax=Propionicimonas sp. T2.31MG-18 TaxID=3157620 RepID=UPI0035E4F814